MHEAEHVPTGLAHSSHLGQDREVVNHKGHLVPLLLGQVLRVAENPKARDVGGGVGVERVHESRSWQRPEKEYVIWWNKWRLSATKTKTHLSSRS